MPIVKNINEQRENLQKALVKKYGEGSVVTRPQIRQVKNSRKNMPDFGFITRDENFKVARGQYVVTSQTDPKAVKKVADKASATLTEAEKAPVKKTKAKTTTKRKTAAKRKTATRKAGSKKS